MSGAPPRDVSALWEALKAQGAPAARRGGSGPSLSGLSGLPGITSTVRTYDKSRGPGPQSSSRPSFIAQLGQTARGAADQQPAGGDCQALLVSAAAARRRLPPPADRPPPLTAACGPSGQAAGR